MKAYYSDVEFIFVLLIEEATVRNDVKWEKPHAADETEEYPHLYAPLNLNSVRSIKVYKHEFTDVFSSSEI